VVGCETRERVLALTFDDGPDPTYTPQILDLLDHHAAKATFFVLGRNVFSYPEIVRDIVHRGHELGNHTFSHARLSDIRPMDVVRELRECRAAIAQAAAVKPILMRPPQGAQTPLSFTLTRIQGYTTIQWSASGDDWMGDPAEIIANRILSKIKPGGIILLHDGCEPLYPGQADYERIRDRKPTIEAVSILLEKLRGYRFATLSEMMRTCPTSKRIWFT
jgi:peptidoglycan/xylan/chitin deacetylase (PgdA/CDA1 family)